MDYRYQKKECRFCKKGASEIDYKDVNLLKAFMTDRGKILPARVTGLCAKHQRKLTRAIKRARQMAILPFVQK